MSSINVNATCDIVSDNDTFDESIGDIRYFGILTSLAVIM